MAGSSKVAVSSGSSEIKSGWYQCQAAASKFRLHAYVDLRTFEVLGIMQSGSVGTWTYCGLTVYESGESAWHLYERSCLRPCFKFSSFSRLNAFPFRTEFTGLDFEMEIKEHYNEVRALCVSIQMAFTLPIVPILEASCLKAFELK